MLRPNSRRRNRRLRAKQSKIEKLESRNLLTGGIDLEAIGTHATGIFDESAAEIVAYDAATQRAFYTNADLSEVGILDISDPADPNQIGSFDVSSLDVPGLGVVATGGPNSLDVANGVVAVAIEADKNTDNAH